jgi:hypothetical protein
MVAENQNNKKENLREIIFLIFNIKIKAQAINKKINLLTIPPLATEEAWVLVDQEEI